MRKIILLPVLLALAAFGSAGYYHLTKELKTYGITPQFDKPISSPVPEGLETMTARECGQCHFEIYQEWQTSIHSQAWREDYFQTDWVYDKKQQNCKNCHTPFENQQPELVTGFKNGNLWKPILKPNPDFDRVFQNEGVSCAACHVRNGKIIGPHNIKDAPHATEYDPAMRAGMGVCARCHVTGATRELSFGNPNICSTMTEIEANNIKPNCIGCHMPKVTRPLVEGYPSREGRRHFWRGGHDRETVSGALKLDVVQRSRRGKRFVFDIILTNIGTHHKLPTGTPDRHIVVTMELVDAVGRVVKTSTHKIIRRIIWRPVIFEWSDNRLEFNKPQRVEFRFDAGGRQYPLTLNVKAAYHFLEDWRRNQLKLDAKSHLPYVLQQKSTLITSQRTAAIAP